MPLIEKAGKVEKIVSSGQFEEKALAGQVGEKLFSRQFKKKGIHSRTQEETRSFNSSSGAETHKRPVCCRAQGN